MVCLLVVLVETADFFRPQPKEEKQTRVAQDTIAETGDASVHPIKI
jgi:hypothetical protein